VTDAPLEVVPEDWSSALAIVAHPDDLEYGAASAVARWTRQGKDIRYLLVTRGEAGIADRPPEEVGPLRENEQLASAAVVGVHGVEFLDHPDGMIEAGLTLRRDLARAIRVHRPQVVIGINHREWWGPGAWNHVDHRVVGVAILDAVRDAANPWAFATLRAAGLPAWGGVRFVAMNGSPESTHAVDVTDTLDVGVASLREHATYLAGLGGDATDPDGFLRSGAAATGPRIGVRYAAAFELVWF
jgi:LmbE family N-acetylglucosaminyl deacetylase